MENHIFGMVTHKRWWYGFPSAMPGCGSGGQLTVGPGPAPGEWDVGASPELRQCRIPDLNEWTRWDLRWCWWVITMNNHHESSPWIITMNHHHESSPYNDVKVHDPNSPSFGHSEWDWWPLIFFCQISSWYGDDDQVAGGWQLAAGSTTTVVPMISGD